MTDNGLADETVAGKIVVLPGALEPAIRQAIACADRVHRAPGLPRVTLTWVRTSESHGQYHPGERGQAPRIEMSVEGPTPRMTFLHEMGHLLDNFAGGFADFASRNTRSPLAPVLQVLRRTEACTRLQIAARDPATRFRERVYASGYLLSDVELWARAYAQYVVERGGDDALRGELSVLRNETGYEQHRHWASEDFVPVADALDTALQQLGWKP